MILNVIFVRSSAILYFLANGCHLIRSIQIRICNCLCLHIYEHKHMNTLTDVIAYIIISSSNLILAVLLFFYAVSCLMPIQRLLLLLLLLFSLLFRCTSIITVILSYLASSYHIVFIFQEDASRGTEEGLLSHHSLQCLQWARTSSFLAIDSKKSAICHISTSAGSSKNDPQSMAFSGWNM
jgi:hypothetical protein